MLILVVSVVSALLSSSAQAAPPPARKPPQRLAETGLYSDIANHVIRQGNLKYSPQYPLWSDGAAKARWVFLPPGTRIDATRKDAWVFPVGTKFWKEFSFGGKRVETRLLEKTGSSSWNVATYLWNAEETDATLAPEAGLLNHYPITPNARHDIPSVLDCRACHEGNQGVQVLGFSALQLSTDRDPNAPHAEALSSDHVTLRTLIERRMIYPAPGDLLSDPPRILATTPRGRAALGYLHGNCGGCHNPDNLMASLGMFLRHPSGVRSPEQEPAFATTVDQASRYQIPGAGSGESRRIKPGDPALSAILHRMGTRHPFYQMPPLGTKLVDQEAVDLLTGWVREDLKP